MITASLSRLWRTAALVCLAALVCVPAVHAQVPVGWVQVSAQHTMDAGVPIANGTIAFQPVNNAGVPISFRVGSAAGGQVGPDPFTAPVTAGAFTVLLPDTVLASPVNPCYAVTITDNASGNVLSGPGYLCVQPAGSGTAVSGMLAWCTAAGSGYGGSCNWDLYSPNLAPLTLAQGGPIVFHVAAVIALATPYISTTTVELYTVPAGSITTWALPAGCTTSLFTATAAATGSSTFTVTKNGTTICVGTVAASGTTVSWTSGYAAATLAASDALAVTYSGDATLTGSLQLNVTQTN